jgi:hypothetical protein
MRKATVINVNSGEKPDVYIGRGSPFGNPFRIGEHGDRAKVISLYAAWVQNQPKILSLIHTLRGKRLGCHCAPLPCHGDILAEMANRDALVRRRVVLSLDTHEDEDLVAQWFEEVMPGEPARRIQGGAVHKAVFSLWLEVEGIGRAVQNTNGREILLRDEEGWIE